MAWVFENDKKCPTCGYEEKIFVIPMRSSNYCLSCGWCCYLSEESPAKDIFFSRWEKPEAKRKNVVKLSAIPHFFRGEKVFCRPIEVWDSETSVLIVHK